MARKVSVEIVGDSASVERAFGNASRSANGFNRSITTAEKGASRSFRGFAAGSGVFRSLGRSLAFASGGFLAFAGASALLRDSITGADSLEKAQKGLDVAIQKTGGNIDVLKTKYEATAKAAQRFGINQADATTGLERATVLTGNAAKAQRSYQEALVISKATGKDFNSVLTATAKGQEGITTSLQRYGIRIAKGTAGTEQFRIVMSRFAGQAKANTSGIDVFNATLQNTEEIIGTALLPVLNKYLGQLGRWLDKMNRTGRLQHDVNTAVHDGVAVFGAIESAIKAVDAVTGSFKHTLELLLALRVASVVAGWAGSFKGLAGAEFAASGAAGVGAAAGAGAAASRVGVAARVGEYTGAGAAAAAAGRRGGGSLLGGAGKVVLGAASVFTLGDVGNETGGQKVVTEANGASYLILTFKGKVVSKILLGFTAKPFPKSLTQLGGSFTSPFTKLLSGISPSGKSPAQGGPFGNAKPLAVYASFQLTQLEQLSQAQAALTKNSKDDVAAAKSVIARIKRLIASGHLSGNSLIQALQAEASAQSTIQSAQAAAAQKAQAAAAKAKAIASSFTTSIDLQIAQVEAEMTKGTADDARVLKQEIAQARAALASGKKNKQGRLAALQVILGAQQALQGLTGQTATSYTLPARLQLQLAKAQATGQSIVPVLKKMKAALEKALKAAHGNILKQTDIYNQIASVSQQLGSSATSGLGGFKQASTKALTANIGLSRAQRDALRARLSQLGPHGTVPGQGVGAAGYRIGKDDRPIILHHETKLGEQVIARSTTRYQQRHRRRNPTQRRGPNAGTG